ncbi:hypothetical protein [Nostoc sp.]
MVDLFQPDKVDKFLQVALVSHQEVLEYRQGQREDRERKRQERRRL